MTIALLDPTISSENLGDWIIRDAVLRELRNIAPRDQIIHLATQDILGSRSRKQARSATLKIVGGTNLLSANMLKYRQWKLSPISARALAGTILMGVGWWQYQDDPDLYTKAILRQVLSRSGLHSVRDEYTRQKLQNIGLSNAVNTSCPTLWGMDPAKCRQIPQGKSQSVIFTLTDYHPDEAADRALLKTLRAAYDSIQFWPQGSGDLQYLRGLDECTDIEFIEPSLEAYDAALTKPVDFVGTRLHAGVRALQNGRRTTILAVDNRSREISRDTGLNVLDRSNTSGISEQIGGEFATDITLPMDAISKWRNQFAEGEGGQHAGKSR